MSDPAAAALVLVGAYLVGSIPIGYLVGRSKGIDVRTQGSGNIGATNVARTVGKRLGVLVLILDALKGAAPVVAWRVLDLGERIDLGLPLDPYLFTAVGLAPMIGHCFPIWLRFHGGKGVATALGVFAAADPLLVAIGVAVFATVYAIGRIVSIGSLTAAIAIPIAAALLGRPLPMIALTLAAGILIIAKHHGNIGRLLRRKELKV